MNKLFNRRFIKVSREHYGQLQLLVDYLALKAGGKIELPTVKEMQRQVEGHDAAIIPDPITGGALLVLRKAESGLPS